ncbi:THAP domain-containing protein 9 [Cyphomyrmex costatus]|uniref:THAP domain-containing protein 9 n=1 Tax=Cyphomyrmex costatus TaxID=456900 RepID=A0A151IF23_9HYME|nr:THAP domain-containing protein 9 [Cyphomyrmex costatus]
MFKKCLTNKKPPEYSTKLKKFACTLLFYSTPAYKFIRESFNNTLPHPQTVRRWFSTVNFNPGINKSILINIRNMIESERSKDKELQFGMQVDEMSLKKEIEFKHDACHALKLVRNTFADCTIYDHENNVIRWSHLLNLVEIQEREGLHPATKIRRRHVCFQNEKMKVKLAAQVLSESVAKALLYMEKRFPNQFIGASSTSIFCQTFNDCFDILNSRNTMKPILESSRKTGFLGIIVGMQSVFRISHYLFTNNLITYVLTYKFSQDHLETFFSSIRKMGGFCNKPTCYQFKNSYKKLVSHVNDINVTNANCLSQDDTSTLQIEKQKEEMDLQNLLHAACDHDYDGMKGWAWSEYHSDIVTYIAGFIVKSVQKTNHCKMCLETLQSPENKCELISLKNRKFKKCNDERQSSGLIFPSEDVITVCKIAEQVIRTTNNVFATKNILDFLIITARKQILPLHLFKELDLAVSKHVLSNHKFQLINQILKKYFTVRLQHASKSLRDTIPRIRTHFNRLVIFKNQ